MTNTYKNAGVDIDAGIEFVNQIKPIAKKTMRPGADTGLVGFGGLFDLKKTEFEDPILVGAADGVGTKLQIAIAANELTSIGIDLVAMCVNDLIVQGATPLFFLDYYATGKLDIKSGVDIISGIGRGCEIANCTLIGGETAEMPGMYSEGDFDLAGFSVGAVERENVLPRLNDVADGDVILGLASTGLHANGFSLVRYIVEESGIDYSSPAPFQPDVTLGNALLAPTKIYVRSCLAALGSGKVKALAHITGGGLDDNIPRVLPEHVRQRIEFDSWDWLPVFNWLAEVGKVPQEEMQRTFNCGIGMVLIVSPEDVSLVENILKSKGETVSRIGTIEDIRYDQNMAISA